MRTMLIGTAAVVAALTIVRAALTKSDCLIKSPSNDRSLRMRSRAP